MESKFTYAACYCEENIWHLANDGRFHDLDSKVVLITGPGSHRKLWFQRGSGQIEYPVYWDYHVVLLVRDKTWQVWDLDTTLGLPVDAETYFRKTFRGPDESYNDNNVLFRTIDENDFIANFSSDRSHMKLPSGDWAATPPGWPPILNGGESNLMEWLNIESTGPGKLMTLEQILAFCSSVTHSR